MKLAEISGEMMPLPRTRVNIDRMKQQGNRVKECVTTG
jgi:hypothetical protein